MNRTFPAQVIEAGLAGVDLGTIAAIVDLEGELGTSRFSAACEALVRALPILGCRYQPGSWRDRWVACPQPANAFTLADAGEDLERMTQAACAETIDPMQSWPLRIACLQTAGRSRLVFTLAHLVSDGNGLLTVVREFLALLAGGAAGAQEKPMDRGVWQLARAIGPSKAPAFAAELVGESARIAGVRGVGAWADAFAARAEGPARSSFAVVALEPAAAAVFAAACKPRGATVNDGLVAAALQVAARFHGGRRTGVAYTVNLRKYLKRDAPIVANLSGFTLVTSDRPETAFGDLVRAVARITGGQKNGLLGVGSLLLPLLLFGWLPHGLIRGVSSLFRANLLYQARRLALMTNVGVMDPYLAPLGPQVVDAWMAGPFVPGFPAPAVMATSYRGRLTCVVSGAEGIDPSAVGRVAQAWREALDRAVADSALTVQNLRSEV